VSGGIEELNGVKTITGLTTGNNETAAVTFSDLSINQTMILGGRTLTATAAMTADQVATAWKTQTGGNGTFSGTLSGWKATGVSGAVTTFVSTASGDPTNLLATGTGTAVIATTPATTVYLDGVYKNVALTGMTSGENGAKDTVTVSGGIVTDISITET